MCCFTLKKCCGLSLPTASIVIGWLSAVISTLQSIACITILICLDKIVLLVGNRFGKNDVELEMLSLSLCVYVSLYLGVSILDLVASGLVIIGTHKKTHLMLLPWLINNMLVLVIRFPLNFVWIGSVFSKRDFPIGVGLFLLAYWGVLCWIWTAIYSHFREMRRSKDILLEMHQKSSVNNYEAFKDIEDDANTARY